LPDSLDGFVKPLLIASGHDDSGALLYELLRDREADSLRPPVTTATFPSSE
jgi:hypothetical protein